MALDVAHIEYLLSPTMQICGLNGKPLIGGYIEVYLAGTDTKVITYQDFDGTRNPFKIPLKADGRAIVLADPTKSYDVYFYDSFGNLAFSRLNVLNAHGPVYIKGTDVEIFNTDGTLDITQTSRSNNTRQFEINTKHKSMGVQEPLYFVEDSPSATIIGLSGDYVTPQELNFQMLRKLDVSAFEESASSFMDIDKLEFDQHDKITAYNGSAFAGGGANYDAGNYVDITDDVISVTGLPTYDDVASSIESATSSLMPSGDYATREELTAYQPVGDYATHDELTAYQTTAEMTAFATKEDLNSKQDAGNYYSASNPSGFVQADVLNNYATTADLANKADTTALNNYATTAEVAEKLDTSAFSDVSGTFLTAHQDLSDYQTTAGMTAYATQEELNSKQDAGNYYSASNPSGFITGVDLTPYQTTAGMTAYQQKGNYLSASDSAKFYPSTANPSGYLTAHQSLAGYATTALVSNVSSELKNMIPSGEYELVAGNGISLTDNTATKQTTIAVTAGGTPTSAIEEMIQSATSGLQPSGDYYSASNPSGFITGVDLTPYQTTAGMTAYQEAGSYLSANALDNVSGNWNEVSAKLDTTAFSTVSGNFLTAHQSLDGYLQDSDLDIDDNKVTAISGVPLAGGSVASPLNTIIVDGNNIEATNSAVGSAVIPAFTANLGSVSIYNDSVHALSTAVLPAVLPASGATITFYTDSWANEGTVIVSGKDANGNIASVEVFIPGTPGGEENLGPIVSAISARGDTNDWLGDFSVSASKAASTATGVYELAWKNDTFSGKNRTTSGTYAFSADIDTDFRLSVNKGLYTTHYSLLSAYARTDALSSSLQQSTTLIKPSNAVEMSERAFRHANTSAISANYITTAAWYIQVQYPSTTAKKYLAVVSFDDTNDVKLQASNWYLANHSGTRYTFATKLDDTTASYGDQFTFTTQQAGAISNVEASAMMYDGSFEYDELAFKSDLTGSTVPTEVLDAASAVSANSATWNSVTAKLDTTAFSNVSGSFLTAHQDLSDYQTKADMTAYQEAGDYYSASNPSGFISEVPAGTMNESEFEYDANNKISAYNGSAFAGGSEFPQSATEAVEVVTANSATWNDTSTTVSTNSAAWGGSALPISAGPGIKFEMVNNTLVASTDETVLWEGTCLTQSGSPASLSEAASNFDKIAVYAVPNPYSAHHVTQIFYYPGSNTTGTYQVWFGSANAGHFSMGIWQISNDTSFNLISAAQADSYPNLNWDASYGGIIKVVGINRIATTASNNNSDLGNNPGFEIDP